jgi:predicted glycoside hydrolase/deacetylase ChbG (UPF0249 family)
MKTFTLLAAIFLTTFQAFGQNKNLAEKLGYPKDAKLLIIHADDAGFAHAADSAIISAYEKGVINSASIMVPCTLFPEIAAYAKRHPELDWGVHLTLTDKCKSVAPPNRVKSLLDPNGYFYATNLEFVKNANVNEAEKEIRAQINKALKYGIKLTHIDNHMGSIFLASPGMMMMYQKVGKEYGLPVLIPMNMMKMITPKLLPAVDTNGVIVNNYIVAYAYSPADKWKNFYNYQLQHLKPGLNELVFHLAFNGDEMRAVTGGVVDYGADWRQQDYDYATSAEFKNQLKQQDVYLVTWGMIQKVMYGK